MKPSPAIVAWGIGVIASSTLSSAPNAASAAEVAHSLGQISLDANQTYRVRDLHLRRGDVSLYFNDGILSFATPVNGKRIAAVFTTAGTELGDGEVLLMPPVPAERSSLASFAKSPNLDEHIFSAILYFSDATADELLTQIAKGETGKPPEMNPETRSSAERILRNTSAQVKTRMISALLDPGDTQRGFFYAGIQGRDIGTFDILYEPDNSEPVMIGAVASGPKESSHFELWASYRPKNAPPYRVPDPVISDYEIDVTVQPDLTLTATAGFQLAAHAERGRVISLELSRRLHIESAAVDGMPVEVFQNPGDVSNTTNSDFEFLLVLDQPLDESRSHHIQVSYSGSIIARVDKDSYFVSERNLWYPHTPTMLTNFDLCFHCPERLQIVSSGDAVSESVNNGIRTVRRRTASPQQMAGFNLGEYQTQLLESPPYRIESYIEPELNGNFNGIPEQAAEVLKYYTAEWGVLSDRSLMVTPIAGDFGQGFPGLIYLGRLAYLPEALRPADRRTPQDTIFFSNLLLPHEIAHQWWGDTITPADYRSEWLMEAMANDSALEFIRHKENPAVSDSILDSYRTDLGKPVDGKTFESAGPVDFGSRILGTAGFAAWQTVIYKKGTWVLRMLRTRMGDGNFGQMQAELMRTFAGKPINNDEFRQIASRYIPKGQPDRDLELFFETWIYGTGIPKLSINRANTKLSVKGVDGSFSADLPLRCRSKAGVEQTRWLRIEAGENSMPAPGCKLPSLLDFLYLND